MLTGLPPHLALFSANDRLGTTAPSVAFPSHSPHDVSLRQSGQPGREPPFLSLSAFGGMYIVGSVLCSWLLCGGRASLRLKMKDLLLGKGRRRR